MSAIPTHILTVTGRDGRQYTAEVGTLEYLETRVRLYATQEGRVESNPAVRVAGLEADDTRDDWGMGAEFEAYEA